MILHLPFPDWIRPEIIPGLPLRWYGLMYLVAFGIAYLLFRYQIKERGIKVEGDTVVNWFFWGILGLLIGARLFSTLLFDPTGVYIRKPWLIFWPFDTNMKLVGFQGMNYYGGLVGALAALIIYSRVKKIDLIDWADMLLTGIPLGYTFGRLGNFINGELFGRVTTLPWGIVFPHARRLPVSEPWVRETAAKIGMDLTGLTAVNLPRHPTQLYEALSEGIILWLILWFIFRKRRPYPGFMIGAYILGYGFIRFIIDYFRMPLSRDDFLIRLSSADTSIFLLQSPFNFITSQVYSFLMILAGVLTLIAFRQVDLKRREEKEKKISPRKLRKKIK